MVRYVAFLRGLNVGGHTVKMVDLKGHFERLGLHQVSTFIASGNVLFASEESDPASLEKRIEQALQSVLGYQVATFVRTDREVARIAAHAPFPSLEPRAGDTLHIAFVGVAPDASARARVLELANEEDLLHLYGAEVYWLRRGKFLESTIAPGDLERALGRVPITVRNANTVRRIAAKLPDLES